MEIVGLIAVLAYLVNAAPQSGRKPLWALVLVLCLFRLYQVWQ
jgi:hypothetical protein